ncbi:MAG: hypothetical protein ACU0BH_01205 [Paracoccaceae bacterium]|uniref:hypothetical protein n=1 Tax=Seohaeicola saemankumensis TaxID=481181 RepID=UPI001E4C9F7C|nr:hypothetical protein [Seohaeicola saemankumensis]MCD1628156.1 hypothetical protein [Seohaeicola saemankumensis]
MTSRRDSLCIFGDSHIGSIRKALNAGLVELDGLAVEFWGAAGPAFRQIDIKDGVVRPESKEAAEIVARVNGLGRLSLVADDFDGFLFYGARLRMAEFMVPYLHVLRDPKRAVSGAVMQAAAQHFLVSCRAFRIARSFARSGKTKVFFAPAPLMTKGILDFAAPKMPIDLYPFALEAEAQDRARIWGVFADILAADGITLIAQPDETIVDGAFTDARYAIEGALESGDAGHKSPEFAALMLGAFLQEWH